MIWLIVLVLILQSGFHWILKPAILFTTPIFEISWIGWIVIALFVWLFSGRDLHDNV